MLSKTKNFAVFSLPTSTSCSRSDCQETDLETVFDSFFNEFTFKESCTLSLNDRKLVGNEMALTYGEISSLHPIKNMFKLMGKYSVNGFMVPGGKFYDLGSGIGRPVIAAALLHSFSVCIGIEILPGLHNVAEKVKSKYQCSSSVMSTKIEFVCGSILNCDREDGVDWTDGDVVYANSTCFDADMMCTLSSLGARMKRGSFFITLSRPLQESDGFRVLEEERHEMSWGMADYFLHIKV